MIPDWLPPKALAQPIPRRTKPRRAAFIDILSCLLVWLSCAGYAAFLYETRGLISNALLLYAAVFAGFWFFLLYKYYREKVLVAKGHLTQAILMGEQEAFKLFGRSFLNLAYDFYNESGIRVTGKHSTRWSGEVHPRRLTVLYDPDKDSRNVLYPPRYVIAVDDEKRPE